MKSEQGDHFASEFPYSTADMIKLVREYQLELSSERFAPEDGKVYFVSTEVNPAVDRFVGRADAAGLLHAVLVEDADGAGEPPALHVGPERLLGIVGLGILRPRLHRPDLNREYYGR